MSVRLSLTHSLSVPPGRLLNGRPAAVWRGFGGAHAVDRRRPAAARAPHQTALPVTAGLGHREQSLRRGR